MSPRVKTFWLAVLLGGTVPTASADGSADRRRLKNGLDVILRPVDGADDVALVVLYSLGGDHDPEGKSGLAHLVEHVYVTAATGEGKARTADEYAKQYPKGWNAQTGDRYTVFATVFPKAALASELEDAALRMRALRLTEADLAREKPRVLLEVESMFGGIPGLAAMNLARERVRPTPRGGRKGGDPATVVAITLDDVRARWETYYKPANALLVVAGGLAPEATWKTIEQAFAAVPSGEKAPEPAESKSAEIDSVQEAVVSSSDPAAEARVSIAFAAPAPSSPLYPAFLVIAGRLLISSQGWQGGFPPPAFFGPLDDPEAIVLSAPLEKDEGSAAAAARVAGRLEGAFSKPVSVQDGRNAANAFSFLLDTGPVPDSLWALNVYGLAFGLGRRAQLGIDGAALTAALAKVTDDDVHRLATEVFAPERRGAAVVRPAH